MRYKTQTENEIESSSNKFTPWPDGTYDFEIFAAEEWTSSAGNDSIKLTIHVFNRDGERRTVFNYLSDGMPHILKHAAEACGLGERYARNEELVPDDFAGKTGKLKLGTDPAKGGYPAKNAVRDFMVEVHANPRQQQMRVPGGVAGRDLDDEIPF